MNQKRSEKRKLAYKNIILQAIVFRIMMIVRNGNTQ